MERTGDLETDAKMKILLVSNLREEKGLFQDARILTTLLKEMGHDPFAVDFRDGDKYQADLVIFLEVLISYFLNCAPRYWWFVNPEWVSDEYLCFMPRMEKVLCKTQEAFRLLAAFEEKPNQVVYTGFMCEDKYDPAVERERVFFHACRGSMAKGTQPIKDAWRALRYPLVIADGLSDEEMKYEQNRCLFHLQPSWTEGFGLALHEGMSCGAVIASTDIPPMSEMEGIARLIKPVTRDKLRLATIGQVDMHGVAEAVKWMVALSDVDIEMLSAKARNAYLSECVDFKKRFAAIF